VTLTRVTNDASCNWVSLSRSVQFGSVRPLCTPLPPLIARLRRYSSVDSCLAPTLKWTFFSSLCRRSESLPPAVARDLVCRGETTAGVLAFFSSEFDGVLLDAAAAAAALVAGRSCCAGTLEASAAAERRRTCKLQANAQFTPPARHDKTVLSVS